MPGTGSKHPTAARTCRVGEGTSQDGVRGVFKVGDGAREPELKGRHHTGLAHAVGAMNQNHLRIERNNHRSTYGTEILDRE